MCGFDLRRYDTILQCTYIEVSLNSFNYQFLFKFSFCLYSYSVSVPLCISLCLSVSFLISLSSIYPQLQHIYISLKHSNTLSVPVYSLTIFLCLLVWSKIGFKPFCLSLSLSHTQTQYLTLLLEGGGVRVWKTDLKPFYLSLTPKHTQLTLSLSHTQTY